MLVDEKHNFICNNAYCSHRYMHLNIHARCEPLALPQAIAESFWSKALGICVCGRCEAGSTSPNLTKKGCDILQA